MSNKRILPALILAGSVGPFGAHRFYAGRYFTGLVQLILFVAGLAMLSRDLAGLQSLRTIDQMQDWILNHQLRPLPLLLLAIPTFWALYDCMLLFLRRFPDGAGNKMTRWI